MAIQNFIGGSFKGKLGAVVGQRWKNKNVLKTYTKPANPRTKKQQSNRGNFAQCVQMAQLAMQMNFNSPAFTNENTPEWGLRIGTARKLYTPTLSIYNAIPLLPYGTVAKYGVKADFNTSGNVLTFYVDTEDNVVGRSVSVLLLLKKAGSDEYEPIISQSQVSLVDTDYIFTATIPTGYEVAENSIMCAVSNDDTDTSTIIYRPTMSIYSPIVNIPFTLSSPSITPLSSGATKRVVSFTPSVSLEDATISAGGVIAGGVSQGVFKTASGLVTTASTNNVVVEIDTNVLDELSQCMQFPSGSSITIPAFSFTVENNRYVYNGGTFSLSETTVQQVAVPLNFLTESWEGTALALYLKEHVTDLNGSSSGKTIVAPVVENNTASQITRDVTNVSIAQRVIGTNFFKSENVWGKARKVTFNFNGITMTANGVVYGFTNGTQVELQAYITSNLTTVSKMIIRAYNFRNSSGTEYAQLELRASGLGQFATLFTTAVLPTSIPVTAPTKTWNLTGLQNAYKETDDLVIAKFNYDWQGTYEDEPYPTIAFNFRESINQVTEVPNTDGFMVGLQITPSETAEGYYSSWDRY